MVHFLNEFLIVFRKLALLIFNLLLCVEKSFFNGSKILFREFFGQDYLSSVKLTYLVLYHMILLLIRF